MMIDGPGIGDAASIPLTEWYTGYGIDAEAMWPNQWYDIGISVASGNISLSLTGSGITGGSHTSYTYAGDIQAVISLQGGSPSRDVLFDNVSFTPEPATLSLLAIAGVGLLKRRNRK